MTMSIGDFPNFPLNKTNPNLKTSKISLNEKKNKIHPEMEKEMGLQNFIICLFLCDCPFGNPKDKL